MCITALKHLTTSQSPLVINTPLDCRISMPLREDLSDLEDETKAFLNHKRASGDFFAEETATVHQMA